MNDNQPPLTRRERLLLWTVLPAWALIGLALILAPFFLR